MNDMLITVFTRLRRAGFGLGVGELLAAIEAAEGDFMTNTLQEFQALLRLLWCKSFEDRTEFDRIWNAVIAESPPERPPVSAAPNPPADSLAPFDDFSHPSASFLEHLISRQTSAPEWTALPVCAPPVPAASENFYDLAAYWPVPRRAMVYAWRYLRHPVADGPEDVVDVAATVERVARQRFFLAPVYRRRERNHAHLVLMIDQGGSMMPLHRFSRDLVETAQRDSSIERVDAVYFHNTPGEYLYTDSHLTKPVPREQVFASCTPDSSVLIVSDAGAARGYRRQRRIQATSEVLFHLRHFTTLIGWLNPIPQERWSGTSAQIIAHLVRMFQMDADGLNHAIDIVRGQPFRRYR